MPPPPLSPLRRRAAAVIINRGHLLVIGRQKDGRNYSVLPGGGVEEGESPQDACLREVMEETGLDGRIIGPIAPREEPRQDRAAAQPGPPRAAPPRETYFLVAASGTPVLGGPEAQRSTPHNTYAPQWVPLADLDTIHLAPLSAREAVDTVLTSS